MHSASKWSFPDFVNAPPFIIPWTCWWCGAASSHGRFTCRRCTPRVDANDGIHLGLTPTNRFFMNSKAQCMFVCMLQISALITKCIIYNNIASINYNSHKLKNLTLPKTLVTIKK